MIEQNQHDYEHRAMQQDNDLIIYDEESPKTAWIQIDTSVEVRQ